MLRASASRPCRLTIQRFVHARRDAFLAQCFLVFLAQKGILQPVWNGGSPFGDVDRALVGILLARHARLVLAVIVGAIPTDEAKRLLADAEMCVEPIAAIGGGGDKTDRLLGRPVGWGP